VNDADETRTKLLLPWVDWFFSRHEGKRPRSELFKILDMEYEEGPVDLIDGFKDKLQKAPEEVMRNVYKHIAQSKKAKESTIASEMKRPLGPIFKKSKDDE
jgi:hypothetical protein